MLRKFSGLLKREDGGVNIGNMVMLGLAMIFIAVGFIVYPIILEGTDEILAWTGTTGNFTLDDFTGLEPVTSVAPLIVLIGFITAGVITGFFGIKNIIKGG